MVKMDGQARIKSVFQKLFLACPLGWDEVEGWFCFIFLKNSVTERYTLRAIGDGIDVQKSWAAGLHV
jgi:hypothetical protein